MHYKNKNVENQVVQTDGNCYSYCMFKNCRLEYAGGTLPEFEECTFLSSGWFLVGPAAKTIEFLQRHWSQGDEYGRALVEDVIEVIKRDA